MEGKKMQRMLRVAIPPVVDSIMVAPKPALLRHLGLVSATALVVSNMIGTGIFTSTGYLAGDLGSPSLVLWIWVVGGVCALLGAMCYSELGVNFPKSGGEYLYLTRAFGPSWGFMTGWASFFAGFSAPIAAAALAFSEYLGHFFPALRQESAPVIAGSGEWTLRFGGAQAVACALVAVFTRVEHLRRSACREGAKRADRVEDPGTAPLYLARIYRWSRQLRPFLDEHRARCITPLCPRSSQSVWSSSMWRTADGTLPLMWPRNCAIPRALFRWRWESALCL